MNSRFFCRLNILADVEKWFDYEHTFRFLKPKNYFFLVMICDLKHFRLKKAKLTFIILLFSQFMMLEFKLVKYKSELKSFHLVVKNIISSI